MKQLSKILENLNCKIVDSDFDVQQTYPSIHELEDGEYEAMYYACTFELKDGRKFKTDVGVRHSRRFASFKKYNVINGKFIEIE